MSKFNQYLDSLHRVMSDAEVTDVEQQSLPPSDAIEQIIVWLHEVRDARKKNIFIGNGGSAAIARHMAIDYSKNELHRNNIRIINL